MNPNVIITCALTGAGDTVDKHPAIPVTPAQIAAAVLNWHWLPTPPSLPCPKSSWA